MDRREVQAHAGFNIVIAKLYQTHDSLRELTGRLDEMATELAARHDGKAIDRGFLRMAVGINDALQQVMHAHHGTEDEVIFPYLAQNFAFDASKLDAEHEELLPMMVALQGALVPLLEPSVPASAASAFASVAKGLRDKLGAHIDHEESTAVVALLKLTRADIQRMFGGRL